MFTSWWAHVGHLLSQVCCSFLFNDSTYKLSMEQCLVLQNLPSSSLWAPGYHLSIHLFTGLIYSLNCMGILCKEKSNYTCTFRFNKKLINLSILTNNKYFHILAFTIFSNYMFLICSFTIMNKINLRCHNIYTLLQTHLIKISKHLIESTGQIQGEAKVGLGERVYSCIIIW